MTDETASRHLACQGDWDLANLTHIKTSLKKLLAQSKKNIVLNGKTITKMDSAGAWLLTSWINALKQQNIQVELDGFSTAHLTLIELVAKQHLETTSVPPLKKLSWLAVFGKSVLDRLDEFHEYLAFIGQLTYEAFHLITKPKHFRWSAFANIIDTTGLQALPIIALLTFMIGVVLAYQMGVQLRNYGANVFIVNLLGLSILREFGPLITAIMVAGRTGSAFTAQLGIMKINQEVDALNTMGVTPGEILLLPRILGLVVINPNGIRKREIRKKLSRIFLI